MFFIANDDSGETTVVFFFFFFNYQLFSLGQIKVRTCLAREQPAEESRTGTEQVVASHLQL